VYRGTENMPFCIDKVRAGKCHLGKKEADLK
jgi:hypothetical protein